MDFAGTTVLSSSAWKAAQSTGGLENLTYPGPLRLNPPYHSSAPTRTAKVHHLDIEIELEFVSATSQPYAL